MTEPCPVVADDVRDNDAIATLPVDVERWADLAAAAASAEGGVG